MIVRCLQPSAKCTLTRSAAQPRRSSLAKGGCATRHERPSLRACASPDDDLVGAGAGVRTLAASPDEVWEKLSLVQRKLGVAVADEDYALAATLRNEVKNLSGELPPVLQYALGQVARLRSGKLQEQLQAVNNLGEAGEPAVIPDLAACLAVPELQDATEKAMWNLFMRSRDPRVNEMMAEGCTYMRSPDLYDRALHVFNRIVQLQPGFVEAHNKRATVHYLMGRYANSIEDCRVVLQLQPYHFGAASGLGLCYLQLSRYDEAMGAFEAALRIHPGMANIQRFLQDLKRHMRSEGGAAPS